MPPIPLALDVVICIVDLLDKGSLLALCRTSRVFRALATPALYRCVELGSYCAFYSFARTLDTRPALRPYVNSFIESRPFLYDETGPPSSTSLIGVLARTPNLRHLRIVSYVEVDAPAFAQTLAHLDPQSITVPNLSLEMASMLEVLAPVRDASLRAPHSAAVTRLIAAYVLRARETLRSLEVDAVVIICALAADPCAVWPQVRALKVHGDFAQLDTLALPRAFPAMDKGSEASSTRSSPPGWHSARTDTGGGFSWWTGMYRRLKLSAGKAAPVALFV